MAQQKVVVEVVVSDNGTTKIVTKGMDNLGQAADRAGKKVKGAADAQNELNYKLNQGTTGVSSAARSFSKLNQAIGSGPNGLVGAYATLAANAFAVSAAFNALRESAQVEQMMKGLEVQGARTGKSLVGISNELKKLTGYSISAADAMQTTALMSSAGFSTKGMTDLTRVATNAAYALGRNVPDALDRISKGVTKLEPELLDELGIMTKLTEAQSAYALSNNKSVASLTSFEKRQAMLNAVVQEGTAKFGGLTDQIEANPFDKLAASFSDLTKNVLSVMNTVLAPLANVFSNKGMLLGAVILFGSTIRKQLLPALYLMGKVSKEMRDSHMKEAEAIRDKSNALLETAKAAKAVAVEEKKAALLKAQTKAAPKGFNLQSAATGTLDESALQKEIAKLDKSINAREANVKDTTRNWSAEKVKLKNEEIAQIKTLKQALEDLYSTQKKEERDISSIKSQATKSNLEYYSKRRLAQAADIKSQAVEAAYAGDLKKAWDKASESALAYKKAVINQSRSTRVQENGSIGKQGIASKIADTTAIFGNKVSTFASVGAAAFMKFIPYVGIATTALSGAWALYEKFIKSDAAKAHEAALEKLREKLDTVRNSIKELNRLNDASVSLGLRAAQSLIIQANAAEEIAAGFKEVQDAAADIKAGKVDSIWDVLFGSPEDAVAYATGVAKDSKYFKPIADEFANSTADYMGTALGAAIGGGLGIFTGPLAPLAIPAGAAIGGMLGRQVGLAFAEVLPQEFNGIDEEALASAIAVDRLAQTLNTNVFNALEKAAGGAEALNNSQILRTELIKNAAIAYAGVADAVNQLQEAFKQASTAVVQFFKSAVPTTSFDGLVAAFQSIDDALYSLNKTAGGSGDLEQQFGLLVSMPAELKRTLTVGQQQTLAQAEGINNQANVYRQTLERINSELQDATGARKDQLTEEKTQQQALLDVQLERLRTLQGTTVEIENQLKKNLEQVSIYQAQARGAQTQLTLHSAIVKSEQEFYDLSAEGEARRIDMQNRQIRLQQTQLRAQQAMIDLYLAEQKANQVLLQQELGKLNASQALTREAAARGALERENNRQAIRGEVLQTATNENQRAAQASRLDALDRYIDGLKRANTQAEREANLRRLTNTSLADTIKIGQQGLNDAEKNYFYAAQSAAITELQRTNLESQTATTRAIADLEQTRASLAAEIAALETEITNEAERRARISQVLVRIEEKNRGLLNQSTNLASEGLEIQESINDVLNNRTQLLSAQLRSSVTQNLANISTLRTQRTELINNWNAQKQVLETQQLRGDIDERGIANLQEEHRLNLLILDTQIQNAEKSNELLIYQTLLKGGLEETLNNLKSSLDFYQKRLDLVKAVGEQETEIAQNTAKIALLRAGAKLDPKTEAQFQVEAAAQALRMAEVQRDMRIAAINAEYSLLDAQRKVQVANLRMQSYAIRAFWQLLNPGQQMSEEMKSAVDNIDTSIGLLESVNVSSMKNLAIAQARNEAIIARQRYDLAVAERDNINRGDSPASAMLNVATRWQSQQREMENLNRTISTGIPDAVTLNFENQKTALQPVIAQLSNIHSTQRQAIENSTNLEGATLSSGGVQAPTRTLDQMLNQGGYNIGYETTFGNNLQGMLDEFFRTTGRSLPIAVASGIRDTATQQRIWDAGYTDSTGQRRTREGNRPIARPGTSPHETANAIDIDHNVWEQIASIPGLLAKWNLETVTGDPGHIQGIRGASRVTPTPVVVTNAQAVGTSTADALADSQINSPTANTSDTPTEQQPPNMPSTQATVNMRPLLDGSITTSTTRASDAAERGQLTFTKFFDILGAGAQDALADFEKLSNSASELLGQDFGPQGRIFNSINGLLTKLPTTFASINGAIGQNFEQSWTTFSANRDRQNATLRASVEASGQVWNESMGDMTTKSEFHAQKMADAFNVASQIIGSVASLVAASSQAKIGNIDKEIAAEQKRDGKSKESLAKIDAMEKKKDSIARKQFNTNKKLMMAQAVMSTAAGIASVLGDASVPVWVKPVMAGVIGAMGLAQIAIIAGTQYESSYSPQAVQPPSSLSVGKRSDTVNLANGPNANAGGELAYIRGSQGTGSNASNYNAIGSAYGGPMQRGYGNRGFVVGEKGPEVITPETPITVTPANENNGSAPVNATINIQAIDSQGVQDVLVAQKGNIIQMLRQAANASGQRFLEDVNVNVYTRPNVGKLL